MLRRLGAQSHGQWRRVVRRAVLAVGPTTAHAAKRQVWAGIGAYRIPSESTDEKINVARVLQAEGFILFSYDFTARPSELNPDGAYLERVRRAAF